MSEDANNANMAAQALTVDMKLYQNSWLLIRLTTQCLQPNLRYIGSYDAAPQGEAKGVCLELSRANNPSTHPRL